MNNRIQELAEQAGIEFDSDELSEPMYYMTKAEFDKFGESLIKDCIQAVVHNGMNRPDYYVRLEAAKDIENHFGIERPDNETEQAWWQAIK